MTRLTRRAAAVAVLLITSVLAAGPALADDPPSSPDTSPSPTGYACLDEKAGYEVSGVCQLIVLKAETVCRGDVPWLDYSLEPEGTPNTTTTLVWGDESGQHWLVTPECKQSIEVEDAAFVAVEMRAEGDALAFRLNTDELVVAGPENPVRAAGDPEVPAIYLSVRRGCEARLNRSTYLQLVDLALARGGLSVTSHGATFALEPS